MNIFNQDAPSKVFETSNLPLILKELYDLKINSLLVEGGATLLNSFIEQNLWDEARIFTGNKPLKEGINAPQFPHKEVEVKTTGNDILKIYKNKNAASLV